MQVIAQPFDCGQVCVPAGTSSTPGPEGPAGAAGAAGADGTNAYAIASGGEVMPPEGDSVVVATTTSTAGFAVGAPVFVEFWGVLRVESIPSDNSIELLNLEDAGADAYLQNSAPGTALPPLAKITQTGWQGPTGALAAGGLLAANNLSDVDDAATSRTNLGLGTMAQQNAATVAITGGTIVGITDLAVGDGGTGASTPAGARSNLNAQQADALLNAIAALVTAADELIYATGVDTVAMTPLTSFARTLLDDTTAPLAQQTMLLYATNQGRIALHEIVDMNTVGDTVLPVIGAAGGFIVDKVVLYAASINMTTAQVAVYTAPGGGGVELAAPQAVTGLSATSKFVELSLEAIAGTDWRTDSNLYLRVTTPQGAAGVAAVAIYGRNLSN